MTHLPIRPLISIGAMIAAMLGGAAAQVDFTKHDIYFELNATDGDVGLHGILDGDAWATAKISGPGGTFDVMRAISNQDSPKFGLTELFFESNEPPLEERSFKELTMLFPPGDYRFEGLTTANQALVGADTLSTALPCPANVRVRRDREGDVTIAWRLQKGAYDPDAAFCDRKSTVEAAYVQAFFAVTDPETEFTRVFSADLAPHATRVEVPDEYLAGVNVDEMEMKAEVIVVAEDGNRTAIEIDVEF